MSATLQAPRTARPEAPAVRHPVPEAPAVPPAEGEVYFGDRYLTWLWFGCAAILVGLHVGHHVNKLLGWG